MTQMTNNYDKLYENMKQRFTITSEGGEYTIGEYMLMKADVKKNDVTLPVAIKTAATKSEVAVVSFVSFVNDKLTIKEPPVKDKTIKAFPFRASASAFLSAAVACAFVFSFALVGAKALSAPLSAAEATDVYEQASEDIPTENSEIIFE